MRHRALSQLLSARAAIRWAAFSLGIALCAASGPGARAAKSPPSTVVVRSIRHWAASGSTRVVLDMSGRSRYRLKALADPPRILIEIPSCRIGAGVTGERVSDGVLDRIRVAQAGSVASVILDLPRETPYAHFALEPSSGKPHRIVIDLKNTLPGSGEAAAPADTERRAPEPRPSAPPGETVVVIDPGHGGRAPGKTTRSGIQEKNLNLKLAKLLKTEIERHAGFRAVLVRTGDYDVEWYQRIVFARDHGGHCFVSLHFNSNESSRVRGIELYFLSLEGATDENAEAVAEQENLLLEVGDEAEAWNDDLKSILFDVSQANAIQQSSLLAEEVASTIRCDAPIPFRKVKQANFIVLRGIAMPSILVEGGYLSNRTDAEIVQRDSYLRWLARALAGGIVRYFAKHPPDGGGAQPG